MVQFNLLDSFISPQTGRILSPEDYIPYGDRKDIATPSPILFDIRLDLLKLKQQIKEIDRLNDLSQGKIWIGDVNNHPSQRQTIEVSNLPSLGVASISGLDLPAGKIWRGTASGRPEESNALSETIADVFAINARLLAGNFIMGNAPVKALWPKAQFLSSLDDGMLKKTGSVLQHAVAGTDYVDTTDEVFDDERIALIKQNNKLIKRSTIRVLEGNRILDLASLGVGSIQASNQIASDESIFGTNNVGSREVKIYDFWNNEGRLTKSFNLKGPAQFLANINYIVPTTAGTTGQVLADIGQDVGSTYRKLGFVTAGANSTAKYILQQPQDGLTNAQALSELTGGILKSSAVSGVISIASGGSNPLVHDYVRPIDLEAELVNINKRLIPIAADAEAARDIATAAGGVAAITSLFNFIFGITDDKGSHTPGDFIKGVDKEVVVTPISGPKFLIGLAEEYKERKITLVGDVSGEGEISSPIKTDVIFPFYKKRDLPNDPPLGKIVFVEI